MPAVRVRREELGRTRCEEVVGAVVETVEGVDLVDVHVFLVTVAVLDRANVGARFADAGDDARPESAVVEVLRDLGVLDGVPDLLG